MSTDHHLDPLEVQEAAEGQTTPKVNLHLAGCTLCRARIERAARLDRGLRAVPRVAPPPYLAAQIRATAAGTASNRSPRRHVYLTGAAAVLATLLAIVLVYQAGIELEVGGALEFISFFIHQPEVVLNYPGDALATMVEVLPLTQMLMTLAVVAIVVLLGQRLRAAIDAAPAQGSNHHA